MARPTFNPKEEGGLWHPAIPSRFVSEHEKALCSWLILDFSIPLLDHALQNLWNHNSRFGFWQNPQRKEEKGTCNLGLQFDRYLACQIKTCGHHLLKDLEKNFFKISFLVFLPDLKPFWDLICIFQLFTLKQKLSTLCREMTKQFCIK